MSEVKELFEKYVLGTARRSVVLARGKGIEAWDETGKRYLDFSGGVAVNSLGHAHPAITEALEKQSRQLIHTSNLFYHEGMGRYAQRIVQELGSGKVFFTNSGAESNEGLIKLARLFGCGKDKYEIITAKDSFHGRTMGGISATGQEKVKKGFEPLLPSFVHVPFNDLQAIEEAIRPQTAAILIEGIQGEGGVFVANPEYLTGLRKLTKEHNILLLWDGVQCGFFRTGQFQSFQRILENTESGKNFMPDAIAMAKSMGGGFPLGAFWCSDECANLFHLGSHGTTYGGSPLACAVGLKVWEVVQQEKLMDNIRARGEQLKAGLLRLKEKHPCLQEVRGLGGLVGLQLHLEPLKALPFFIETGILLAVAANNTLRFLPPLNVQASEVDEVIQLTDQTLTVIDSKEP